MNPENLAVVIPIVATVGGVAIAIGAIVGKNRERMAMIQSGQNPYAGQPFKPRTHPIVKALAYMGIGVGILVGYWAKPYFPDEHGGFLFKIGFAFLFGGLGYFIGLMMTREKDETPKV